MQKSNNYNIIPNLAKLGLTEIKEENEHMESDRISIYAKMSKTGG